MQQKNGKKQLAYILSQICEVLRLVENTGSIYGNLRAENIILKMSLDKKNIDQVKFLNFGHLIQIDDAEKFRIPDQVDHLPPDMNSLLLEMQKFSPHHKCSAKHNASI